jgi:hypothetical protein
MSKRLPRKRPPFFHHGYEQHASWARRAVYVYVHESLPGWHPSWLDHDDLHLNIQHLVTDLMHLWHQSKHRRDPSPVTLLSRAARVFADEMESVEECRTSSAILNPKARP